MKNSSRRDFLADVARLAALCAVVPNDWRVIRRFSVADDPFSLGVASGDPTPTSVMLWTRLAPRPLEPGAGMEFQRVGVDWEVADDEAFTKIVKRGRATAAPELGHSLHVDVEGLTPGRWYFYRFRTPDAVSAVGRTRTTPATTDTAPLNFAFVSCQHYEQGLFTAYQHLAAEEVDLVAHLGDYIYEYGAIQGRVRTHTAPECLRVEDYRWRYAQYKSDEHLRAAHTRCPWVVTWDDHEVDNNYAGLVGENAMESEEQMRARRAAGYQAWWENQPVRVPRVRSWSDLDITRTIDWGALARFWVMDTRQYRTDQACGDGAKVVPCGTWASPTSTLMGSAQERWLVGGLATSRARWQVLANQVMMGQIDIGAGKDVSLSMDQWSGYPAARDRLLGAIATRAPNRTVVITGDIHSSWVNEIKSSFSRPNAPTIAAEFVGTSIASGGDGRDRAENADQYLAENAHLKWQSSRRGYVRCNVTPDEWRTEYRTVAFVTRPGAPVETPTKWIVRRGRPGIEKA